MRAISIYEAVRSRQLTPDAIVKLLKSSETGIMAEKALPGAADGAEPDAANDARMDCGG